MTILTILLVVWAVWYVAGVLLSGWAWTNSFDLTTFDLAFLLVVCLVGGPIPAVIWWLMSLDDGRPRRALLKRRPRPGP